MTIAIAAATFDPDGVVPPAGNFIGGVHVAGQGAAMSVLRPSDRRVYCDMATASVDQVAEAAERAWQAFHRSGWATAAPRDRIRVMRRWADLVEADVVNLARLEAVGSTRPIAEAVAWDVPTTAECIRFFSEFADKSGGEIGATRHDNLGLILNQPYGVIGAIAPWNFPLVMACWKIAPALAAGNAVVLKPSEMTPFSVVRLAELAIEAGLPAGMLNIVQGDGRTVGDAIVRHPRIAKITFTGSTRTGAAIMAASAESGIKPVTLELGGKSPQIVFADAPDIARTAATVARAISGNAGQVCVAGSRLIVERRVADEMIDRIGKAFEALKPGATWQDGTTLSPIISDGQCDRIDGIVRRAVAEGATVVTGGGRATAPQDGAFYRPTILTDVAAEGEAVRAEIFGPVLTVQTFTDEEEALSLADHPDYGLAAGVHTGDLARALRAVRRLEAGTVWVNRYGRSGDFILPTGGFKRSGIGRDLGRQAYEANLHSKTALIDFGDSV
ncbi:aldehyde dehydrogenase [Sphingomonas oleivorans]|uniref:Aldehyde dehydrogenase n=1 Tax=Sphingomonas oleivorans TaxID=1735121 RepID=A0A2T5G0Q6_9SPHN|nr:aldehyde dehydrogenase family protein [Sphingomonas oleivorans]PTQ12700.1 aldehyde dehydrogenase [Sphingomonas oleivorans]